MAARNITTHTSTAFLLVDTGPADEVFYPLVLQRTTINGITRIYLLRSICLVDLIFIPFIIFALLFSLPVPTQIRGWARRRRLGPARPHLRELAPPAKKVGFAILDFSDF